ncbi:MAG TPA: ribokinase [Woeseiaceae bacterium]|nr:ribokinase [Woeseiaceae bacterium]
MVVTRPHIVVVGSINLDLVARVERLPRAGETVTNGVLERYPGGKGANQALAARRLGADVTLLGCVGQDSAAEEALRLLREGGVGLDRCMRDTEAATGIALIAVDDAGENQIVVAPGANRRLALERASFPDADALICQLEVPVAELLRAARTFQGFFCINLAPAFDVPEELIRRADLVVVNEHEAAHYGERLQASRGYVAFTHGSRGAVLSQAGRRVAQSIPPEVVAVDATGAGDTFTAALTLALVEGTDPGRSLQFACVAAALATTRPGAQPSLPLRAEVERAMQAIA